MSRSPVLEYFPGGVGLDFGVGFSLGLLAGALICVLIKGVLNGLESRAGCASIAALVCSAFLIGLLAVLAPDRPDREVWRLFLERVGACVAGLIALAALATSAYTASLHRRHQRLSVLPRAQVHRDLNRQPDPKTRICPLGIWIRNAGLGPTILEEIQVKLGKHSLNLVGASFAEMSQFLREVRAIPSQKAELNIFSDEHFLRAGDSIHIFRITLEDEWSEDLSKLWAIFLASIATRVKYRSVYGETWIEISEPVAGQSSPTATPTS